MSSFPRQHARTRRFTLGVPRGFRFDPSGRHLLFLRSHGGEDPVTALWELDLSEDGGTQERCLVDPVTLGDEDPAELPPEERARRERAREMAGGITSFATDRDVELVAFALGGRLFTFDRGSATLVEHPSAGAVFDPRPSPDGRRVAYVSGDALHLLDLVGGPTQPGVTRPLVVDDGIAWGRAEFVAAEEMGRGRGTWWSPDGERVAVCRVDESPVATWWIADPAHPERRPQRLAYPAAGTDNADVRLSLLAVEGGRRVDVVWDRARLPYLARVGWDDHGLLLLVQSRDQRTAQVLTADPDTGTTTLVRELVDDAWVELVDGAPAWSDGRLVTVEDRSEHGPVGSRALVVDGRPVTPPGLQVRALVAADAEVVVFTASDRDPTQVHVWAWQAADGELVRWSPATPGVHGCGAVAAGRAVVTSRELTSTAPRVRVVDAGGAELAEVDVLAAHPDVRPHVRLLELGPRQLRAALLLPTDAAADARLPVLLDPYGGPHAQRVLQSGAAHLTSQWLADQGFAVLVVDGRGSPARGPRWEREIAGDLATPVLEDQIDALYAAVEHEPRLDLSRVAVRGWSFGGYLAALAVLRRPDVFAAAIAGAPVTDWRRYDTHYTERYLGHPATSPAAYEVSSLVDADGHLLGAAPWDQRVPELLLVHGLADDNVVAAHTLQLSAALLADGRPHRFLPLSGVTHMTPQEVVAEQLLRLQVDFLHRALRPA
ncbi:prolyl oligopeptidase family serine peptidase [Egicoccus halophilus]|uniref:Peptidase n=1 Tax=Egicoccus halophilus TaxID=1670830 RepID=A0A8J3EUA2_9ACTN|nr:prolyl oligopeptidase family serine peptidase [Egicoccus halophilus]GGI07277.1 peptidase [Egicoccus halophilus]